VLGVMRAIHAIRVAVATELAADRRGCAPQFRGDPANRRLRRKQIGDPDSFLL